MSIRSLLKLTRLRIDQRMVDDDGKPTVAHQRYINDTIANIESAFRALSANVDGIEEALAAAGIALTTANSALSKADTEARRTSIVNSYTSPGAILTAEVSPTDSTKARITVAAHNRVYGNGTTVAVNGATLDLLNLNDTYYVYYDQSSRAGGTVTFVAVNGDSAYLTAGQTGVAPAPDRHCCGSVATPATNASPPEYGGGPRPGGTGIYRPGEMIP